MTDNLSARLVKKNQELDLRGKKADVAIKMMEPRKSAVRVYVTYGVIGVYLVVSSFVIGWLMWAGRYEVAIGVLGGVSALAGSIAGFWFGSRQKKVAPE